MGSKNNPKRRRVLKSLSVGSACLSGIPFTASATDKKELVGISYDTLTQKPGTKVRGHITSQRDTLEGELKIAGFTIPLDDLKEVPRRNKAIDSSYIGKFSEDRYVERDSALKVKIDRTGNSYSGTLSRPSPHFGDLGFFISGSVINDLDTYLNNMSVKNRWTDHPQTFSTPNEGLPTDSSTKQLIKSSEKYDIASEKGVFSNE